MNWIEDCQTWLENEQIPFEIPNTTLDNNHWPVLAFPQQRICLLMISLDTWKARSLPLDYWQQLADKAKANAQKIIFLWEDLWFTQQDLIKARLRSILGKFYRINARHCIITRIDKPTLDNFLINNHLQGTTQAKYKYGLFLKKQYVAKYINHDASAEADYLVGVASFSGGRTMKWGDRKDHRSFELLRFATLQGYVVVGGMDKLLKAFIAELHPDDIMSYADRDWSDGRSYRTLGFEPVDTLLQPQVYWINPMTLERHFANKILGEKSEKTLQEAHWIKIWNAGSLKYVKTIA